MRQDGALGCDILTHTLTIEGIMVLSLSRNILKFQVNTQLIDTELVLQRWSFGIEDCSQSGL
ncbi:MAG TPA: hypothetical protein DCZ43_01135, partial [candidate division Zixibacteria bacterium]|nr:hypothetical protein [candidate division Zixibacteria bacterium]